MNPEAAPADFLAAFILDQLASQPLGRRVILYRCLASETKRKSLRDECLKLADELESIERRHRQLTLNFERATL